MLVSIRVKTNMASPYKTSREFCAKLSVLTFILLPLPTSHFPLVITPFLFFYNNNSNSNNNNNNNNRKKASSSVKMKDLLLV